MAWTDYDEVAARWVGGAIPADETQITTLIEDIEDSILREFPDIEVRIETGALPLTRVHKVVSRIAIRHLRNPEGRRSTTQGAGPFQQSVTFGGNEPGALTLTAEDRAELAGPTSHKGKAFSVDMTPATFTQPLPDLWEPLT